MAAGTALQNRASQRRSSLRSSSASSEQRILLPGAEPRAVEAAVREFISKTPHGMNASTGESPQAQTGGKVVLHLLDTLISLAEILSSLTVTLSTYSRADL